MHNPSRYTLIRCCGVALIAVIELSAGLAPALCASRSAVRAKHAMVVSADRLASEIVVRIRRRGGNAVDAAVAVGFALAVTFPEAGNLGGGGFMLLRFANGEVHFLDYREKAPAAATENMYLDAQGNVIPDM